MLGECDCHMVISGIQGSKKQQTRLLTVKAFQVNKTLLQSQTYY